MSEEIVDRLKDEGQLIRNTGTNSIRAVRIQLDRFEEIFKTISENISSQTQMMTSMLDISTNQLKTSIETAEREEARRQKEELDAAQIPVKNATVQSNITTDDLPNKKTRESFGLFDLLRGGTGFLNKLLMGALFAGGVYALGNVFKGFIEAKIGESEFTEGLASVIGWTAIGTIFGKKFGFLLGAGNILSNVFDLPEVTKKIGDAFDTEFTDNQAEGIGTALGAALTVAWLKGGLRTKIIGGLIIATELLGEGIKDWLINDADVDPDWANTTVDVASLGLQGALIGGSIGGLPGAIAGALAGLAIGLGSKFINWLNNKRDEATQKFNEDVASIEPLLEKAMAGETLTEEESRELARVDAETRRRFGPSGLALSEEDATRAEETSRRIAEAQGAQSLIPEEGIDDNQRKTRVLGALEGNQENLLELVRYAKGRGAKDKKEIKEFLLYAGNSVFNTMLSDKELDSTNFTENLNKWGDLIENSFDNNLFRRGTKGFQDFGPASFAILHGREAVVPEETPAGRFLNQFFTDNWLPKMAPSSDLTDHVSTAAGGTINMPVIVNNSPTVAPIVNNVQGGPSVTSTNIFGSGGSRSGTFGLSNAVN